MNHDTRPYPIRRAERIAAHMNKRTTVETVLVQAVESHLLKSLRGENRDYALNIMAEGVVNADDTVHVERAQERSEWAWMFVASMAMLFGDLASKPKMYKRVTEVFAEIGVRS